MAEWRNWFDSRLDNAIEAAATQEHPEIERLYSFTLHAHFPRRVCVIEIEFVMQE